MNMQETIARINELSHLSKIRDLTEDEKNEQHHLRRRYIDSITGNLKSQLDNTSVQYPDGTIKKLRKK